MGSDRHPPMNYSTNKRVKAKTNSSVGTVVKKSSSAKSVKPRDGSSTSAKTVKAYETLGMAYRKEVKEKGTINQKALRSIKRHNRIKSI